MKRFVHVINHLMAQASGLSLVFISFFLLLDVVSRLISKPISGASEMAIFSMIVAVYLGVPYCEETKSHIKVDAIDAFFSKKTLFLMNITTYIISLLILGITIYAVGKFAIATYTSGEAIPGTRPIQIYPVVFTIFISFVFYFLQTFVNFMEELNLNKQ